MDETACELAPLRLASVFFCASNPKVAVGTLIAEPPRTDPYERVYACGSYMAGRIFCDNLFIQPFARCARNDSWKDRPKDAFLEGDKRTRMDPTTALDRR